MLEGYAFLLSGVIDLYEATLEPEHLDFAIALAEAMIAKFYDAENGGFWQSAADATDLILRVKDDYDGAEPSGNSVATLALLKLAAITGREDFKRARRNQPCGCLPIACKIFRRPCRSCCTRWIFRWKNRTASSLPVIQAHQRCTNCCARRIRFINRTRWFWATPARLKSLPKPCRRMKVRVVYLCTGNACQPPTEDAAKVRELLK